MNSNIYGRIYKNFPMNKLLRLKMFFMMCRFPIFINNISTLHTQMTKVLGTRFVNRCVKIFFGDIFIGGENTKELNKCINNLNREGILCIADYAREFLTKEEEREIGKIIKAYQESVDIAIMNNESNSVALKVSSLGDVNLIKSLNTIQSALKIIEEGIITNSTYEEVIAHLNAHKVQHHLTSKVFESIKSSFNVEDFTLGIHELLLEKNEAFGKIIQNIFMVSDQDLKELLDFSAQLDNRLRSIFDYAKERNALIMIDAEQTYLQTYIDYLAAYYFKIFNKEKCILATTLQCYLKSQPKTLKKFYNFVNHHDLRLGLKVVRGAYLSEEGRISEELQKENPICNSYEDTNENYNKSIEFIYNNYKLHDKFCIATHNVESIQYANDLSLTKGKTDDIFFAQLLGISEHATGYCMKKGLKIAKYVPFGEFDILIPYLIRRAEESVLLQKLTIQNKLLNEEIKNRLLRK